MIGLAPDYRPQRDQCVEARAARHLAQRQRYFERTGHSHVGDVTLGHAECRQFVAAGLRHLVGQRGVEARLHDTDDDDQAMARMSVKGAEVARVALEMANLLRQLDEQR